MAVFHLSARDDEAFLRDALPPASEELSVAPIEVVIYLKLKSPRAKDRADVVELIKAGADVERCRGWLEKHAADLVALLEEMQRVALAQEYAEHRS